MGAFCHSKIWRRLALLNALALGAALAQAQQLALRAYQTGDGLAHNIVQRIHQDVKGYLRVATYEGLSRLDGYRFTRMWIFADLE